MLPLGLLNAAQGHPMLVELKNGETLNGHLVNCDTWMNLTLKEVVQTNPEGTAFFRLPEVYVRGNNSKSSNRINLLAEAEAVVYNEVEATGDEGLLGVEEDAAGVEVEEVEARQPLGQQMLLEKREGDTCEDKKIHPQRY
ncbi:MAG: hypothetical protein Q9197_003383 [Variospora fuerteventurae]